MATTKDEQIKRMRQEIAKLREERADYLYQLGHADMKIDLLWRALNNTVLAHQLPDKPHRR